jgi:uncharacterized SAM-binding protein YcdF (DUF218 family)
MFLFWVQQVVKAVIALPSLILLALLAGVILRARGRVRLGRALLVASGLMLLLSTCPPVPEGLLLSLRGPLWQRQPAPLDAVVVLGGDQLEDGDPGTVTQSRLLYGIKLYREGAAPRLVFSTGNCCSPISLAGTMGKMAELAGVPPGDILLEGASLDTRENAVETAKLLLPRGWRRIALVSSPTHMRRASATFRKVGFEVVPAPSFPNKTVGLSGPSFGRARTTEEALREWVGLAWYRVRGWV